MKRYNLFREIVRGLFHKKPVRQPTPSVSGADVKRIVRRDFPPEQFDVIFEVLSWYGVAGWERECDRVRLAALKLANGNLGELRKQIKLAGEDYRDVLAAAEYPNYFHAWGISDAKSMSGKERQRIIDADWKQYQDWLAH